MQRLKSISIENYRSIGGEPIEIKFPINAPLILMGENNAGKSNIIRAIELLFGEYHPKYKKLDNYDHFNRDENNAIHINAYVTGFNGRLGRVNQFTCDGFRFSARRRVENSFVAIQSDGDENQYVSNALREELLCVIVNSEQNLSYQLSYSNKYTLLSKVTKSFHDKLIDESKRVEKLKHLFSEITTLFNEVEEFKNFSENMSTIAGQMIANMTHALQFDFSAYDPSNYFRTMRVYPSEGGVVRAFDELGTGQQQILALAFAHAYAKAFIGQGLIFILDEPESHLHPLAQKWLASQMFRMAKDGLQLVITTHSPYFINLDYLEGLFVVRKDKQTFVSNTSILEFSKYCQQTGARRATEETILPFYSAHAKPHILNGFFAKKVILVEGETEELSLPVYFNKVGLDVLKESFAIIGVGGKGNLAKWWRLFTAFDIPTYVCFDNDSSDDNNGNKRKEYLKAIGIANEEQLGELLSVDNWNIGDKFCVFGKNFEATMMSSFQKYQGYEGPEIERLGKSKPIVARAVANLLVSDDVVDGDNEWAHFQKLAERIKNIR